MKKPTDPMELLIWNALNDIGVDFMWSVPTGLTNLDFYLPAQDVYIEVKQFHSDRIDRQLSSAENVIVAQGRPAVELLARLIRGDPNGPSNKMGRI